MGMMTVKAEVECNPVAICAECGGKYRPAGGACIHEHPELPIATGYQTVCGICHCSWQPGHTCIPQPTLAQVQELAAMGSVLRLMDELMERLAEELGVAAPASWEVL